VNRVVEKEKAESNGSR